MDELRRFVRHITPGAVYETLVIIEMMLLAPERFRSWVEPFLGSDAPTAVGVLVASGVLGYMFEAIHYQLRECFMTDHMDPRLILRELGAPGSESSAESGSESKSTAFGKVYSDWHRLLKQKDHNEGERAIESLIDKAQAAGTASVAAFFAGVSTLLVAVHLAEWSCRSVLAFLLSLIPGIFMMWVFHKTYVRVANRAREDFQRVLLHKLRQEEQEKVRRRDVTTHGG